MSATVEAPVTVDAGTVRAAVASFWQVAHILDQIDAGALSEMLDEAGDELYEAAFGRIEYEDGELTGLYREITDEAMRRAKEWKA